MKDKGKDKKSLIKKIKTSPAAKDYREEGPKKVAKTIGGILKQGVQNLADKTMDTLLPDDTTHMQTRLGHFDQGVQEHMTIREQDAPHAGKIVETFHEKGQIPQPFKHGNVSSIMNAFQIRDRKSPPEGY